MKFNVIARQLFEELEQFKIRYPKDSMPFVLAESLGETIRALLSGYNKGLQIGIPSGELDQEMTAALIDKLQSRISDVSHPQIQRVKQDMLQRLGAPLSHSEQRSALMFSDQAVRSQAKPPETHAPEGPSVEP
ncbi:hypothetical protein PsalMR5_04824 (plasmid) [Piscirickettsia salmonis]|nr:hypothetical protein PsalSR1_04386 [Piscirickettsia salmonis]QGP62149.1 hypothetical protein PsalBI1_04791 [Piscirickettsia salmonis]QGP66899.1 hypothetical protein PsalMR5_04824 [Piscirickettsia salmonis]